MHTSNINVFNGMSEIYDRARPSIPIELAEMLTRYLGYRPHCVADIGCGTGQSLDAWLGRADFVYGVEPNIEMRTVAENLKKAEEVYYMANGYYEANTDKLDFDYKGSCTGTDVLACKKFFRVDVLGGSGVVSDPAELWIQIAYYSNGYVGDNISGQNDYTYLVWLDNSSNPGGRSCTGKNDKGRKFCKIILAEQ